MTASLRKSFLHGAAVYVFVACAARPTQDKDSPDVSAVSQGITFVQAVGGHSAYPPNGSSLSLSFGQAIGQGSLLVVSVGFGLGVNVASVTDTAGNTYQPVAPATASGTFQEQAFYAANVQGGSNTVTVNLSGVPPYFFEARALEYGGVAANSPMDVATGASGGGCAASAPGAAAGFTPRDIPGGGGFLAEDRVTASAGAISATETCGPVEMLASGPVTTTAAGELALALGQSDGAGQWVLLLATFKPAPPSAGFVQGIGGNAGYPPAGGQVSLAFPNDNSPGDLLVVSVGWNGLTGTPTVTDSSGNTYAPVSAPAATSWYQEQLFYAANARGGANTVTVTLSAVPTVFLEARAYEYSGVSGLDATASASGTGCASPLVADNAWRGRPLAAGGGSLAEDVLAAAPGAWTATEMCGAGNAIAAAPVTTSSADDELFAVAQTDGNEWVLQVAAFSTGPTQCVPATCASLGDTCGSVPDGCGGTLSCGTCVAPQTCGGGGVPNVCGAPSSGFIAQLDCANSSQPAICQYVSSAATPQSAPAVLSTRCANPTNPLQVNPGNFAALLANVQSGQTVQFAPGTYSRSIQAISGVAYCGDSTNPSNVVLQAPGLVFWGPVGATISDLVIDGVTLDGGGIKIDGYTNVFIQNSVIQNVHGNVVGASIYVPVANGLTIARNRFINSDNIAGWEWHNAVVADNSFSQCDEGLHLATGGNPGDTVRIARNTFAEGHRIMIELQVHDPGLLVEDNLIVFPLNGGYPDTYGMGISLATPGAANPIVRNNWLFGPVGNYQTLGVLALELAGNNVQVTGNVMQYWNAGTSISNDGPSMSLVNNSYCDVLSFLTEDGGFNGWPAVDTGNQCVQTTAGYAAPVP